MFLMNADTFHSGHPFQEIRKDIRTTGWAFLPFRHRKWEKAKTAPMASPSGDTWHVMMICAPYPVTYANAACPLRQEIIQHIKIVLRFIIYKYTIKSLLFLNLKQLLTLLWLPYHGNSNLICHILEYNASFHFATKKHPTPHNGDWTNENSSCILPW